MPIDLHTHSTESDGSFSVEELVDYALTQSLRVLALCDHDTTAGIDRFVRYAESKGITGIGSVELSATWPKGNCHILGYGVRTDYEPLEKVLLKIRGSRGGRNEQIIAKLNELGVNITLEEAKALAGGDVVGRPHMARIMHDKGYVETVQQAFDKYLAKGAPAYVDRYRLEPEDAVALLRDAGATVVLAHPSQLKIENGELGEFVQRLIPHGLKGLEAYTPYTGPDPIDGYRAVAEKHHLLVTGGSDFHGVSKPNHKLGYYAEGKLIPEMCVEGVMGAVV